jgi:murein DD-endopeptidase MepM/ murein hydrolase activator NlpD
MRTMYWMLLLLSLITFMGCSASTEVTLPLPTELEFPTASPILTFTAAHTAVFFSPNPSVTKTRPSPSATATPPPVTPSAFPSQTPSATITNTATPTSTRDISQLLAIDFDAIISLPLELRTPLRTALEAERPALPDVDAYTVSAYRERDGWMKIVLVPAVLVENEWSEVEQFFEQSLTVFARQQLDRQWIAIWEGSAGFIDWRTRIPPHFANLTRELPAVAGEYRFPWPAGGIWWAVNGWHDGNALDFQPALEEAGSSVLAAEAGRLREVCRDGFQSLLMIEHGDGHRTYYLHLQPSIEVRHSLLDQDIERGQYLGELIQFDRFNWACGYGYSQHLHFIVDDRTLVINGFSVEAIAANASCCKNPPRYVSSNHRIDGSP